MRARFIPSELASRLLILTCTVLVDHCPALRSLARPPSAELTRAGLSILRGWRNNCTYMYSGERLCWRETPSPH
ncbi:uncharacterized protein LY79DRAFT_369912 [Colletotrichum navitas]|uniref:Secreted protein n=1 Tax=Colletotrichum navitas TaxID=681940 RepID=A0AAD8V1G1_9PEZI|nr:uncharacterized protein LY79DRAFT_369912 [Colletotrichum navitas]KAK1574335.1 hypothetical protein LY79DRAFT_369912 [Colletotrichum navitas]